MSSSTVEKSGRSWNIFSKVSNSIIVRTVCLWICFFSIALVDSVRGPTLLDVRDMVGLSTHEMSQTFMFAALGGLVGCFSAGYVLDRLKNSTRYLVLLLSGYAVAGFSMLFPYSPSLIIILGNSFCFGFFNGWFHTCANVYFQNLWKGYSSSPCTFALHFSYGLGSLLAPIVAKPFMSNPVEPLVLQGSDMEISDMLFAQNLTLEGLGGSNNNFLNDQAYTVKTLYPLLGVQLIILFLPLLAFYVIERRQEARAPDELACSLETPGTEDWLTQRQILVLMVLVFCIFFCFAGVEISFRTFIFTFTVSIGNSRQVASDITALFYLSFTIVRGLFIFGGIFFSPSAIMWISQALCLGGSLILSFFAGESFFFLQIGVVLLGCGSSTLFPTGVLWLKDILHLTNKLGSVLTVSLNISSQLYCFLIGYIIDESPFLFVHMMSVTSVLLILFFAAASLLVNFFRRKQEPSLTHV